MALHLVTGYAGKQHVTSADQGAFHNALLMSGNCVLNAGRNFEAYVATSNCIQIYDGELYLQGRYIRLQPGSVEEVVIENGSQDYKRNDLIVVRYVRNETTGVESVSFVVIAGTPVVSDPVDPEYIEGNIQDGVLAADFPLYRVPLDGLVVGEPVPLFEVKDNFDERIRALVYEFRDVSVSVDSWVNDTTYEAYPYKADIACEGVTADYVPFVNFALDELMCENYSPTCDSGDAVITIYASVVPTEEITIPSIVCIKGGA